MPARYDHATDRRRITLHERLRRLKVLAFGGTVAVALGMWALVSGAVAATTAPTTSAGTGTTITTPRVTINGANGFFGGQSSLGSGTAQRPIARSRGS